MKQAALDAIARNIERHGYHVYLIVNDQAPTFLYTIGLTTSFGAELLFTGGAFFGAQELHRIVNGVADKLVQGKPVTQEFVFKGLGTFTLRPVHKSWIDALMLGAVDHYKGQKVVAYQIVPDRKRWTADVGDAELALSAEVNRAWRWFGRPWPYAVPEDSTATTNLAALQGHIITEAARWETDEWQLFVGDGTLVPPDDARVVPLGVLLGLDSSLEAVVQLDVGQALWRDGKTKIWNPWTRKAES